MDDKKTQQSWGIYNENGVFLAVCIGNTTPIAQEHEGMSCLVGGSLDWFLIDGDKGIEVVQV